ncbi:hypothetical protein [Streptomyces antarcticus]|uniref:hypothetical protein n=1 Tax=Streptomyces antarcticus TaxID=2996458 RepID=UPI00226E8ECC|nr:MULTISPECIES: hypothetical protein [unclassified Streptomyces]MCY0940506.1 hypothetical protein [Streptomyces sp. H34-AA3]MCZ4082375.1 hypothetical protein [Streptomyces sp. H34-S5]
MTDTTDDNATALRQAMTSDMVKAGMITSERVEAAFLTVARHRFAREATPEKAYEVESAVPTKKDQHGITVSSVSAPRIQAMMLEQADLKPGQNVAEVLESRQVRSPSDLRRTCIPAGRYPEACPRSMV